MQSPTMIVINGNVLTMDPRKPRAEAVAIAGNRVAKLGSTKAILALKTRKTLVIDAKGGTVLPGFNDAHIHVFPGSAELDALQLGGVHGLQALRAKTLDYAAARPGGDIIVGQQISYGALEGGKPVNRHDLDSILPDRPMLLIASDHHTAFANTKALELAGVLRGKALPPGNEILMGSDGLATGELHEMAAFDDVLELATQYRRARLGLMTGGEPSPYPAREVFEADLGMLRNGMGHLARHGITSFHNMDGNLYTMELLAELERRDQLTARAYVPLHFKPHMPLAALERASTMHTHYKGDTLKAGAVKFFMDGVIDSYTAVMRGDYGDRGNYAADPLFSQDQFNAAAADVDRRGMQIAVHAIGDGAVNMTLNGFEFARKKNGRRDSRHRIEHIETLLPSDIKRFKALGVLASMQPSHPPGVQGWPLEPTIHRIGEARWPTAYGWKTLQKAGARLVFGTDWPITGVNPMQALHSAMIRKPWRADMPDQRVSLHDAIEAYTVGSAYAEFAEDRKGQLKRGMLADVTVLSENLETIPANDIQHVNVSATISDGRIVHSLPR